MILNFQEPKSFIVGFKNAKPDLFKPLLDYYNELTDFGETEPNAIIHHQISQYGPHRVKNVESLIEHHKLHFVRLVVIKE